MLKKNLTIILALAVSFTAINSLAGDDVDIANDHLLYFAVPSEMEEAPLKGAGLEAFADDYDDSLLYFMQGEPGAETESRSDQGVVDYSDEESWPLTPDNYL